MTYDSHQAFVPWAGSEYETKFCPKNPRIAPSVRLSLDVLPLPFGSLLLTAGYRFQTDVPLQYWAGPSSVVPYKGYWEDAHSDLKHRGQIQLGALVRFDVRPYFDFGVGVEARNDWMEAVIRPWMYEGTNSENTIWRPWLRANARYLFDRGTNITPFVGIEAAVALGEGDKIHPTNYFIDFYNNTHDYMGLDLPIDRVSPDSYTRGHTPLWEFALVAGIRFGRHGAVAPPVEKKAPPPPPEVKAPPPPPPPEEKKIVVEQKTEEPPPVIVPEVVEAPPPPPVVEQPPPVVVAPPAAVAPVEIQGLRIHFATNSYTLTAEDRAIVRRWAAKYKGVVDPAHLTISVGGHTDKVGARDPNMVLSVNRATALANALRAEGINIPATNVSGYSFDVSVPGFEGDTPEDLAKNRRAEAEAKVDSAELRANPNKYKVINEPVQGPVRGARR
jgi:outer membrane protein OmpA-like peptidoglycan-associated protein